MAPPAASDSSKPTRYHYLPQAPIFAVGVAVAIEIAIAIAIEIAIAIAIEIAIAIGF